ncbi:MAG TPA: hypothetical protein VNT79_00560 [Phycisphaerae bacterium]|nr:hypothetical protein [Phycisphaerae bacterium]
MKTAKKFDCVKMKDDAQLRLAEQMRGFSEQERLNFYQRAHEEFWIDNGCRARLRLKTTKVKYLTAYPGRVIQKRRPDCRSFGASATGPEGGVGFVRRLAALPSRQIAIS